MAKKYLSVNIAVSGLYQTLTALGKMPDNAKGALKDTAFELSQDIAKSIRLAARAQGSQAALMAGTVTTGSGDGTDSDLVEVQAGGSGAVGRHSKPAYKLLFGSEFGAVKLRQFKARNTTGYWFFPTVTGMSEQIAAKWSEAADKVITEFAEE
jgi:hypothetical protein